ncbi:MULTISPECIES: IclR family transcriptional regulator [Acinetobacter]|uniref:IclR family transcriptional regulator n=1 Tax=Acinetobacter TaxID=469 RepID=UPI0002AEB9DC|nr:MULTISPECIES: IclR family transcriptional regulator [Acinetobacter]ELW87416.1 transcriptional regulator, IclR family, C-terminal domain protein [Acinetobacter sp. WC-743]MBJ8425815.1 IclR family transcriptional regulator [Acinetobacter bereziniae]MBJ8474476.1 IclR family transcriptional regulator [Acinetobacter bereziniae]
MNKKGSSITRVLDIIEAISTAKHPPTPLDLSVELDIPKPSIHRLLQTLEQEKFVKTDMYGGYILGDRTYKLLLSSWEQEPRKMERLAILQKLSEQINETCGIAILNNNQMLYTDRVQANWPLQVYLPVGSTVPLWCSSSGKLFLSFQPSQRRKSILEHLPITQLTRNTITDPVLLEENLDQIYLNKIGTDNEEFISGMVACSVPIQRGDTIIACLYVHAPTIRKSLEDLLQFEPLLRQAAHDLNKLIEVA